MVVPLKLTQFYGHSVPRPRIYADVKFSDQRVDPPISVNDALLSWASDAHWSMGGLSFKTFRSQGKVEGNVRKLRAFLEEDEDAPIAPEKAKPASGEATSKSARNAATVKPLAPRIPSEKKRQRIEEESVEATPVRKLSRRDAAEESTDDASPVFVPATHEKVKKVSESAPSSGKKELKLPAKAEVVENVSPSTVGRERRREKLFSSSGKNLRRSKSPSDNGNSPSEVSPSSDGGRSTRSSIKPRAGKIFRRGVVASDEDSSESDDGLEAFLKEKRRTPRRSSRLVKGQSKFAQTSLSVSLSVSDSESE